MKQDDLTRALIHAYRSVLRTSAPAVRFSRPAAKNTRRYLRDEIRYELLVARNRMDLLPTATASSRDETHEASRRSVLESNSASLDGFQQGTIAFHLSSSLPATRSELVRRAESGSEEIVHSPTDPAPRSGGDSSSFTAASTAPITSTCKEGHQGDIASGPSARTLADAKPGEDVTGSSTKDAQGVCSSARGHRDKRQARSGAHGWAEVRNRKVDATLAARACTLSESTKLPHISTNKLREGPCKATAKSRSSRSAAPASPTLAHRVVANLSHLTYHHLSPNTQMQTTAPKNAWGQVRKAKKLSSIARVLGRMPSTSIDSLDDASDASSSGADVKSFDLDDALEGAGAVLNKAHLRIDFLHPSVKQARGPVTAVKAPHWDGQNPTKHASEGSIALMQSDLDTINALLDQAGTSSRQIANASGSDGSTDSARIATLRKEADVLRKEIKTFHRLRESAAKQATLAAIPISLMAELVAGAQDTQQIWLGKQRWATLQRGGFLPP